MADFIVTNANDSGTGSFRQAILDANSRNGEDRIIFDNSLSGSTINLTSGQIRIADDLVLEGLNADSKEENITIDAGGNSRVFLMSEDDLLFDRSPLNVTIKRLNLTGGFTSSVGGAIYMGGGEDSLREHNLTIERSIISGNRSGSDGGAIYYDTFGGNLSLFDTTILDNSAAGDGGGIATETGNISLVASIIQQNNAGGDGGGVYNSLDNVFVDSSLFVENRAGGSGGGLNTSSTTILQSIFVENQAVEKAGGIITTSATIILNSSIIGNETDGFGGGISISNFGNNGSLIGFSTALIANTTISTNKAKGDGGGIWVSRGVRDRGNTVVSRANLLATNVTITDNVADSDNNGSGNGGGIYNTIYSRFDNVEEIPGNILLLNSIIAGNFDTPDNSGTGFIAPDINGAARGDANNLLGNTQGLKTDELFGVPLSESLGEGSDLKNIDPRLGELQTQTDTDNDTPPTLIHPLLPDSPAINRGNNDNVLRETFIDVNGDGNLTTLDFDNNPDTTNAQLPYDQRLGEFSRIVGGTVDIGAFELQEEEGDRPPIVANPITDITVEKDADNQTIDLSGVFSDIDSDNIQLEVANNSNSDLVTPLLNGNDLTLDFLDNQSGTAEITIRATADGQSVEDTFTVTVGSTDDSLFNTKINRFQNNDIPGTYLFAKEDESENIRGNFPNFNQEGLAFKVADEPADNLIPLYRFQSLITPGTYLFAKEDERQNIKENFSDAFTEEGLAFYVYEVGTGIGTELTRFQNEDKPGTYLFALPGEAERIKNDFPNFVEEGAAFEVVV